MKYYLMATALAGADLALKNYVDRTSPDRLPNYILNNTFIVKKATNKGFAGGRLEEEPKLVRQISTALLAVSAIASIPIFASKKSSIRTKVGMALLLGGAASNVIDRSIRGYVVDYLQINMDKLYNKDWPLPQAVKSVIADANKRSGLRKTIFNMADVFILVGGVLLIIPRRAPRRNKR